MIFSIIDWKVMHAMGLLFYFYFYYYYYYYFYYFYYYYFFIFTYFVISLFIKGSILCKIKTVARMNDSFANV